MDKVKARWGLESEFPNPNLHQFCWPKQAGKFILHLLIPWINSKWLSQQEEGGAREARDHGLTGFVTFLSRIYYEQNFKDCLFPTKNHPRFPEITSVEHLQDTAERGFGKQFTRPAAVSWFQHEEKPSITPMHRKEKVR